jgi:AcrR family transcriptional regulator
MQQATTRRRTQAERRAETESRLLQAAMDLVAEGGVGAVTVAATGVRAGYSRGIVNHHFGSRRALLDALAREMQGRFPAPETRGTGLARVLALVDAYLDGLGERPRDMQVFLVLWTEAIASDPDRWPPASRSWRSCAASGSSACCRPTPSISPRSAARSTRCWSAVSPASDSGRYRRPWRR